MAYVEKRRLEARKTFTSQNGSTIELASAPLPASQAIRVQFKLQKILGPAVLALAGGYTNIAELLKDERVMFSLIRTLQDIDTYENEIMDLIAKFCDRTQYSFDGDNWKILGKPGTNGQNSFDEVFLGMFDVAYQWLFWNLELNFKDFLESLKNVANANVPNAAPQKAAE